MRLPLATKDGRANLVRAFKASGCEKCGVRYPEVDWSELHIDHIDPQNKPRASAFEKTHSLTNHGSGASSAAAMLSEMLLCQVLCRKCHVEKTRGDGQPIEGQLAMFNGNGSWFYE